MSGLSNMWFLSFTAIPVAPGPDFEKFGGAQINCWLELPENRALVRASEMIESCGWRIKSMDASCLVTAADYEHYSDSRRYYDQALIDQEVLAFHTWPNEMEDGKSH
jgi:hypothetical protein